jgi:hypothetical protein
MRTAHVIGLIFPLLWGGNVSFSQQWQDAGIPLAAGQVRTLYADTLNNKLYVGGSIIINGSNDISLNAVWIYDGNNWSYIDTVNGLILSIIIFNHELYVGGMFSGVNSQNMPYLVKWSGNEWVHAGGNIDEYVMNMKVINNELYVMGKFNQIGNISNCKGIAKFDGTNWSTIFNFPGNEDINEITAVSDITFYNGEIYIGGNFERPTDTITDLAVYKNGAWQKVGATDYLRGGFNAVNSMEVYDNELYVGGMILKNQGNVGYLLQKWNGQNWSEVGLGLKDNNFSTNALLDVRKLLLHENKLIALGGFCYAGNLFNKSIALWDGIKWCGNSYNTNINHPLDIALFFNDTLYVNAFSIDNNTLNKLAKWDGTNYFDTCGSALNVSELKPPQQEINIYPNPNNGNFNVVFSSAYNKAVVIRVFNNFGQCVYNKQLNGVSSGELVNLNIEELSGGMYFVNIETENNMHTLKMAVQN